MENPSNLLLKLSRSLFADTAKQEKFIQAVINPQCFNPPILWVQPKPTENPFDLGIPLPWQPEFSEWLLSKFPEFQSVTVPHLAKDRSHLTEIPCYRMWPQDKLGMGAFIVLFQNTSQGETHQLPADFLDLARFTL